MAGVGEGDARSAEIAAAMGRTIGSVAPLREALIRKGMIYSTGFGRIAFTVPLFGDFMRRAIVEDE
jgi:hypothetical protein